MPTSEEAAQTVLLRRLGSAASHVVASDATGINPVAQRVVERLPT